MSTQVIKGRPIWVGGYEFSNQLNSAAIDYGAEDLDGTTLDKTTRVHVGGLKTVGFALEGFFEAGSDKIDDKLFENVSIDNIPVAMAALNGDEGEIAYFLNTLQGEYVFGGQVGELLKISAGGNSQGDLVRGTILAKRSTSGNASGPVTQLGAAASGQKIVAGLFVSSGTGTLDVVLSSDDNGAMSSDTTRITFAQATGPSAQIIELAGPVTDTHWQIEWTITGGVKDFMVAVGIQ